MGLAIVLLLAYAAGVAISPTPILVILLILFSASGRRNGFGFLGGWIIGLSLLALLTFLLLAPGEQILTATSSLARPLVQCAIGLGVIWLGKRRWNVPPQETAEAAMPKWMASADQFLTKSSDKFTPRRALALALFMSAFSPKNIALMLAFGLTLTQADFSQQTAAAFLFLFVILSSLTIGLPVLYAALKGDDAQETLNQIKRWVMLNRSRALALLLFALGAIMLLNALVELMQNLTSGA
ncbi:MAG: hypothetical protein HDKAJFGB_03742 [Anaerolineae bacterium]|nr:hypothetical protein [Anaerolineae bacterium]